MKQSFEFATSLLFTEPEQEAVFASPMVQRWWEKTNESFEVERVVVETVDYTSRSPRRPLFVKLQVEVLDQKKRPLQSVVILRGDAVGVLVVLKNSDRGDHLLLVRQARLAIGEPGLLEIPAGMIDRQEDPLEVALREVQEETGLIATSEELVDLLPTHPGGFYNSVGLLDERLYLYLWERETTREELERLAGSSHGEADEGEHILLELSPADDPSNLQDSKSLMAWLLWRQLPESLR